MVVLRTTEKRKRAGWAVQRWGGRTHAIERERDGMGGRREEEAAALKRELEGAEGGPFGVFAIPSDGNCLCVLRTILIAAYACQQVAAYHLATCLAASQSLARITMVCRPK